MAVDIEKRGDVVILRPQGPDLNYENHQELRRAFGAALAHDPKLALIDLKAVTYVDSVGLGSIVSGRLNLQGKCEIHLCGLAKSVEATIRFARLDLIFSIHESVESAIKAQK